MDYSRYFAPLQEMQTREARGTSREDSPIGLLGQSVALVSAALFAGKRFLATEGGMNLLGKVGRGLSEIGHAAIETGRMWGSAVTGAGYAPRATIENFELLGAAERALNVFDRGMSGAGGAALRSASHGKDLASTLQSGLDAWGFGGARPGIGANRAVTVGDVLGRIPGQFSPEARGVLSRGIETGILRPDMAITTGYGGLFLGSTGNILDTRMFKPQNFLETAYRIGRNIRVPFTQVRPADIIASVVRPFGRGAFAGEVGAGMPIGRGINVPNGGINFVSAGQLYSDFGMGGGFRAVGGASGIKLGQAGTRVAQAHLERMGITQPFVGADLRRRMTKGGQPFWQKVLDTAQSITGIGPEFRTRDQFLKAYVKDPYVRRVDGTVVPLPYVRRGKSESFIDKLIGTLNATDPAAHLDEYVSNTKPLSWWDKFKAYLGASDRAAVIKKTSSGLNSESDLLRKEATGVWASPGTRPLRPGEVGRPDMFGKFATSAPLEHYAYKGGVGETLLDIGHMMTNRLNDLSSRTFGMGFRPSVGGWGALGKNVAKLYGIYGVASAAAGYAGYLDYQVENLTGVSPKKTALAIFGGLRVAQQALRQVTGISAGLDYAEDLAPKSVDSGLSWLARTIAPPVVGAFVGGKAGLLSGLAVSLAVGGTDPSQSPGDLIREYQGDKLVPIRKSRYWMLGRQPFEGGQIDYFAPSWFAREMSDYKFTSTLYGSKGDYYERAAGVDMPLIGGLPLPTPTNLFGLVPLIKGDFLDPGTKFLAAKHKYDRPYPDTPGVDEEAAKNAAIYMAARGPYDAPLGAGERLGMGTEGDLGRPPRDTKSISGRIGEAVDKITELGGIHKFLWWDMPGFSDKGTPKLAEASDMRSQSRSFYDEQMGGAFGLSELYRRFVPPPEKGINPLINTMPEWLPGVRSAFTEDKSYHIDFTLGDPYAKLKMGEFRLPGESYERLHRLHSGTPGVYDAVDRYMILADVAPNSRSFKEYKEIVKAWGKAGVLDDYWRDKIQETAGQVKAKMEKYQFVNRRFTGMVTDPNPEATSAKYNSLEKGIGAGWEILTHDLIPKMGDAIPVMGPLLSDKLLVARSPIEQYMRTEVYGEEFADWKSPWKAFLRPKLNLLAAQDQITAPLGGAALGLMGATPLSALAIGTAGAIATGITSSMHGSRFIPDHRKSEWELQEYFDNIRYVKSLTLKNRAEDMGDAELAAYYQREQERTVAGLNYNQGTQGYIASALKALPRNYKSYFMPFMNMPRGSQEAILPYLPEDIQPVFAGAWMRPKGVDFGYRDKLEAKYHNVFQAGPESRSAQYFDQNTLPDSDWSGWHPDVPLDAVKIKMVDSGSNSVSADIHKFDLYPEHRFRASRFDSIEPIMGNMHHVEPILSSDVTLMQMLNEAGFTNVNIRQSVGPSNGPGVKWRTRYDNRRQYDPVLRSALR